MKNTIQIINYSNAVQIVTPNFHTLTPNQNQNYESYPKLSKSKFKFSKD